MFIARDPSTNTGSVHHDGTSARVLLNGQVVVDWTSGFDLSGVPIGDGYTLEILKNGTVSSQSLTVGIVIGAMGQSNMQLWAARETVLASDSDTYMVRQSGSITNVRGTGARVYSNLLSIGTNAPILYINSAVGGSALFERNEDQFGYWLTYEEGQPYAIALDTYSELGVQPEFILWAQGETDKNELTAAYVDGLRDIFDRIGSDFDDPSIIIQGIAFTWTSPQYNLNRYSQLLSAQMIVDAERDDVKIGAFTSDAEMVDSVHYDGASYAHYAFQMAVETLSQLGVVGFATTGLGTDVVDVVSLGNVINYFKASAGADVVYGGSDIDVVIGGSGADLIFGQEGNDILLGENDGDEIYGGGGDDIVGGGAGVDLTHGGDGNDEIWGGRGNDQIFGDLGTDLLNGGPGSDVVFGGDGNDIIYGGDGDIGLFEQFSDQLDGGGGNDTLYLEAQDSGYGGDGSDILNLRSLPGLVDGGADFDRVNILSSMTLPSGSLRGVEKIFVNSGLTVDFSALEFALDVEVSGAAGGGGVAGGTGADKLKGGGELTLFPGRAGRM